MRKEADDSSPSPPDSRTRIAQCAAKEQKKFKFRVPLGSGWTAHGRERVTRS